jgi:folate-binding protein YgfZ
MPQQGGCPAGRGARRSAHDEEATGAVSIEARLVPQGMVWCDVRRDVVQVSGPDAVAYLQGQCSQDVAALASGASAWTFLLQPTGKVDVFARVTRAADDAFLLDTDGGSGAALEGRLRRFLLRTKASIGSLSWQCVAVRRPGPTLVTTSAALVVRADWHGQRGFDLLGEGPIEPPLGAIRIERPAYERLRVVAGWPAMGAELTADTIPAETGVVTEAANFTKGCYTGQELVARIDSRGGHVPRLLRHVRLERPARPGDALTIDDRDVGMITSVAGDLALAYVGRSVEPPASTSLGTVAAIPGARFVSRS